MTSKKTGRLSGKMLSVEKERELIHAWRIDEDASARDFLIKAHEPMIFSMARRFGETIQEREDLKHEGVVALMTALNRFDLSKDIRFSTYAVWWVFTLMQEYRTGKHVVRLGKSRTDKSIMGRMAFARREFSDIAQEDVERVISDTLGVSISDVAVISELLRSTPSDINDQYSLADPKVGDGTVLENIAQSDRERVLKQAIEHCCDARGRGIIEARWITSPAETYISIGKRLGISGERVRQIEGRAVSDIKIWLKNHGFSLSDMV